jgi:hypothetical protein
MLTYQKQKLRMCFYIKTIRGLNWKGTEAPMTARKWWAKLQYENSLAEVLSQDDTVESSGAHV